MKYGISGIPIENTIVTAMIIAPALLANLKGIEHISTPRAIRNPAATRNTNAIIKTVSIVVRDVVIELTIGESILEIIVPKPVLPITIPIALKAARRRKRIEDLPVTHSVKVAQFTPST
jgi:hypothetical protein